MAKTKQKREILAPAVKGSVSPAVIKAKIGAIPRVVTTDLVPGDRVLVYVLATRENIAGHVLRVLGTGKNKRIRIDVIGDGRLSQREFRVTDCKITKVGRSGATKSARGFLKDQYVKPGANVGQIFRIKTPGKSK